jgi:predicted nucleotidyltransferase
LARRGAAELYRLGAKRVWLFGSLAKGRTLDERSDLDFAVEGLPPELLFRAWSEVEALLECPIDLVEWERATASLRAVIERERVLLPEPVLAGLPQS